jgi:hypothetical protein
VWSSRLLPTAFLLVSVALATPLASSAFGSDQWAFALGLGSLPSPSMACSRCYKDLLRWRLAPGAYLFANMAYALGNVGVGIYLVAYAGAGVEGCCGDRSRGRSPVLRSHGPACGFRGRLLRPRQITRDAAGYSGPLVLSRSGRLCESVY